MGALSRSYALAWFDDRRNYAKDELGIRFPAFPQVIALGADQRLPRLTPQAGGTDRHEFSVNQQLAIGRRRQIVGSGKFGGLGKEGSASTVADYGANRAKRGNSSGRHIKTDLF